MRAIFVLKSVSSSTFAELLIFQTNFFRNTSHDNNLVIFVDIA